MANGIFTTGATKPAIQPIPKDIDASSLTDLHTTTEEQLMNLAVKTGVDIINNGSLKDAKIQAFNDYKEKILNSVTNPTVSLGFDAENISANFSDIASVSSNLQTGDVGLNAAIPNLFDDVKDYQNGELPFNTTGDINSYYPISNEEYLKKLLSENTTDPNKLGFPSSTGVPTGFSNTGDLSNLLNKQLNINDNNNFISVPFKPCDALPELELQIPVTPELQELKNKMDLQNIAQEYLKSQGMDLSEFSALDYDAEGAFNTAFEDQLKNSLVKEALLNKDGDLLNGLMQAMPDMQNNSDVTNMIKTATTSYAGNGEMYMVDQCLQALKSGDITDIANASISVFLYSQGIDPQIADSILNSVGINREDLVKESISGVDMDGINIYKVSSMDNNGSLNYIKDGGVPENHLQMASKATSLVKQQNTADMQMATLSQNKNAFISRF